MNPDPSSSRSIALRYTVPAIGLLLVVPAVLKGSFAFIRTFTHTLSSAIFTLELMVLAFGIGVGCLWWWQQQKAQPYYTVMQVTLEQLIREQSRPFTALEFAERVKLPIGVVKPYLARAVRQITGVVEVIDRGEVYYSVNAPASTQAPAEPVADLMPESPMLDISLELPAETDRSDIPSDPQSDPQSDLQLEVTSDSNLEQIETQLFDRWDREPIAEPLVTQSVTDSAIEPLTSDLDAIETLTQAQLARRLNVSASTIGYHKLKPDFADWVRSKDPDGFVWFYSAQTKQFVRVKIQN